jgi:copper homeostasis protein
VTRRELICGLAGVAVLPLSPASRKPALHLEIVASCLQDARTACAGGATRLELAVNLEQGGLTPPVELARAVTGLRLPVRIMLRENAGFEVAGAAELELLEEKARALAALRPDGLVLGWVKNGRLDLEAFARIAAAALSTRFTVHNAIERTLDPLEALRSIRNLPRVDRVLVSGGSGSLDQRIERLRAYEQVLGGGVRVVVGNLILDALKPIQQGTGIREFHLGNAVRTPPEPFPLGEVDAEKVKRAKDILLS